MVFRILVGFLFCLLSSRSFPAEVETGKGKLACWQREEQDPYAKKTFPSKKVWSETLKGWKSQQPTWPGAIRLYLAYKIYQSEKDHVINWEDKVAHCYMGCRIARTTNYITARYVAWYKELFDLSDCDINTHFEKADYKVTIYGANQGLSQLGNCENICLILKP